MSNIFKLLSEFNAWSTVFRIFLAVVLGGLVGLERGHHGRAAGLRTHILVCLGAAMSAMVGIYSVSVLNLSGDPMRIGAQVVSGIGFLGVGTIIIRNRRQVTGLTTAAGLWATASMGLAIGVGYYIAALGGFLAVILTMELFIYLEKSVKGKVTYSCYIELSDAEGVNTLYDEIKSFVSSADVIPAKSGMHAHVGLEVVAESSSDYDAVMEKARSRNDIIISLPLNN